MTKLTGWNQLRRGKLLVLMGALVAGMVLIAACGGNSKTATPEPSLTPDLSSVIATVEALSSESIPTPGLFSAIASVETSRQVSSPVVAEVLRSPSGSPSIQYNTSQQVGIWVTGRGEVTVAPDLAILNVGVEARAATVQQARNQAATGMDLMAQALSARGIASEDIQTRFFNVSPEYAWDEKARRQELVGFIVSNQVTVKIRDIENVGPLIDEVVDAGGDLARIQGVSFTIEDSEALESQAREKAVRSLEAKAQQIADLSGVQLGRPVFLSESGGFVPRIEPVRAFAELAKALDAAPPTTISGGELTVSVTVQGVYSIIE